MSELLRFETESGSVVVEVEPTEHGFDRVARPGVIAEAGQTFEIALRDVRDAAAAALRVFRDGTLRPDDVEIEFGVRLSAGSRSVQCTIPTCATSTSRSGKPTSGTR